jgi:hypothetical protein
LALAEIYAGGSRSDAARIGGIGLQLRDWVLRFNAEGPRGLLNGKAPGTPNIVDDSQRQALRRVMKIVAFAFHYRHTFYVRDFDERNAEGAGSCQVT